MRISDWSSDVCSSDLEARALATNDRAEYEAYVTLQTIGSADSLREIVRQSAELGRMRGVPPEGAAMTLSVADARAVLAEHFPPARAQLAAQVERDRIAISEGRRVGKECVSTCRFRGVPY